MNSPLFFVRLVIALALTTGTCHAARAADDVLRAGVGKTDITDREAGPVHDPLFVKALVLEQGMTRAAIVTVDAVAIGEIGRIDNGYLRDVRAQLEQLFRIPPTHLLVNASHCHGVVKRDIRRETISAVRQAVESMTEIRVGVGTGHEDRVQENRRMKLKDGSEIDVRHAYAMPPDDAVVSTGPIDPEIGILRLDRTDGRTLAIVYNFACHPIQGVASGANTADMSGLASRAIEESFGGGSMAFFVQGCAGDINPVFYKAVHEPRDAEPLGAMLGLSVIKGARNIRTKPTNNLAVIHSVLSLPRADYDTKISLLEKKRLELLESLQGTTLNLKTFLQLTSKYGLSPDYPSGYAYEYLREKRLARDNLQRLDTENRRNIERYMRNVMTMEQLTRINTNLRLLKMHRDQARAAGGDSLDVELYAMRVGEFVLLTFPGELTVQIGLNIKQRAPSKHTFVAGYTNGYIYYAPTTKQLKNQGGAQEDSDCLLAPQWQPIFEERARVMLNRISREGE